MHIALNIVTIVALVLLNAFFVAAEFALVKIRGTQLDTLLARGHRRARIGQYILANLNSFLSAAQLGVTMASLGLGWVGEPIFTGALSPLLMSLGIESEALRHSLSFALGFSALTFIHISIGEQAPKLLAIQNPLPTTLWISYPMLWFYRTSYPFVVALNWFSQWLLRQVGLDTPREGEHGHSEDELRLAFAASQKQSGGTVLGRDIVLNALDLRRRIARQVMRPRQEVVGLDTEASIAECLQIAEKSRYSRFPLCEKGDLDKTLGVVHIKDLYAMRLKARSGIDLASAARKLIYAPETARLEKLLQLFLERKLHMAIIVDEYGGTMGLLTLENILEELVGQIQDEFDQEKPLLVRTGETTWEVAGTLPLHELQDIIGGPLQAEGVTTASGWVTQCLGGFPKVGDIVDVGSFQLRVEAMDGMRVERLRVLKKAEEPNAHL